MSIETENITELRQEDGKSQQPDASVLLARGLLQHYEPHLKKVELNLNEFTNKQKKLNQDLENESALTDSNMKKVEDMIERARIYKEKLNMIRKQMAAIHHKTQTLKKRALYIQTCKEKEFATKMERRLQEEALIGKKSSQSNES